MNNKASEIAMASNHLIVGSPTKMSLQIGEFGWIWIGTIVLFMISAVVAPGTVRVNALLGMLPFAAILAIVAIGQTLVIQQRGIDMSSAGLMTLGGLLIARYGEIAPSISIGILGALVVVAFCGLINGLLVAKLHVTPIVATLASNSLFVGATYMISGGSPISVPASLAQFSHERVAGVPYTLILAFGFITLVSLIMSKTIVGRRFIAVGANHQASAAAGIETYRYQVGAYVAAALCFGVAGMIYAGFIGSASQTAGNDYLLPGIAVVIVGGTPLAGGRGSVIASGVAAIFITQLTQMVLALGASTAEQLLVQAGAIVVATVIRYIPNWRATMKAVMR